MSWTDGLDKKKYAPSDIKRWKSDEARAKKQFAELRSNPFRDLPITAPARHAYDSEKRKAKVKSELKSKVAKKMAKKTK